MNDVAGASEINLSWDLILVSVTNSYKAKWFKMAMGTVVVFGIGTVVITNKAIRYQIQRSNKTDQMRH